MRPPMNQKVSLLVPLLDSDGEQITDRNGRPVTRNVESKARVLFKTQLVADSEGRERRVNLEIDLPREVDPASGTDISYITIAGVIGKGVIVTKEEITNIAGNKIYFRTVYVDG